MNSSLPIPVLRALRRLGADIQSARKRRRISTVLMSQRANISRMTLSKIEKGDPTVTLGSYSSVLFILGMNDRIAELANIKHDQTGIDIEEDNLPKRIRIKRRKHDGE